MDNKKKKRKEKEKGREEEEEEEERTAMEKIGLGVGMRFIYTGWYIPMRTAEQTKWWWLGSGLVG